MVRKVKRKKRVVKITTEEKSKRWRHPEGAPREDMEFLAKELSAFMGLKPEIDATLPDDDLLEKIKEAEAMFFDDDIIPKPVKLSLTRVNRYIGDTWTVPRIVSVLVGDIDFGDEDMDGKEFLEQKDVLDPDADPVEEDVALDALVKEKFIKATPNNPEDLVDHKEELIKREEIAEEIKKEKEKREKADRKKMMPGRMGRPPKPVDPEYKRQLDEVKGLVEVPTIPKKKSGRRVRGTRGVSAHAVALEILCANPEVSELEIYKEIARRHIVVPSGNNGVRAAQILVKKVIGLLKQNGLMT